MARTRQPQTPVRIDWSNPLAQSLEFVLLGSQRLYNPTGKSLTWSLSNPGPLITPVGLATSIQEVDYVSYPLPVASGGTNPWTMAGLFLPITLSSSNANPDGNAVAGYCETPNTATAWDRTLYLQNTTHLWRGYLYDGATKFATSTAAAAVGKLDKVIVTSSGAQLVCAVDGVPDVSTGTSNNGYNAYSSAEFCLGNPISAGGILQTAVPLFIKSNRFWTAEMRRSFFDNPWQIFAPSRRVVVFGADTGGGSTTYTPTVGGTLVFAGTPAYKRLIATITSGGVTYAGTASVKDIHTPAVSGGLTYAGTAAIKKLFKPLVAGGISFTGDAVEKLIRAALAAGGLTFGGTAGFTPVLSGGTIYTVTPTGGIVFGSSAAVKAIHQSLAEGGLAYSGEAGYNLIREIIAAGGLSFAGAATVSGPVTPGTGTLDQATIDAIALAVWQRIIDAGLTAEELLRLIVAHAAGNATGLENGSPNFKSLDGTKNRITGTYAAGTRNVTGRDAT